MPTAQKFWCGTAESYNAVVSGLQRAQEREAFAGDMPSKAVDSIWAKQDGLGIIEVSGSLTSGSTGYFGRLFGVLGYDDIRQALSEAAVDPEVKTIFLSISSGGGSVSGVDDLAKYVSKLAALKPVAVYTDSMMASAAYWLAAGATAIYAGPTAVVGSIGVLSVHTERSAQLKEDGIAVTVVRAGRYKALANSVEPLTEEALAEVQGQVNDVYDVFISHVAASRDVTVSTADTEMGQGREFLGKRALAAGLVDKIVTYEQAILAAKKLDKTSGSSNNSPKPKGQTMKLKAQLTESQLAALAAGATLASLGVGEEILDVPAPVADVVATEVPATEAVAAPEATAETVTEPVAEVPTALSMLTAQLATASDALVASKVETATLKTQVETQKVTHDSLLAIARAAVGKMSVALGGNAEASASMDAVSVVAEYARVTETFNTKFKVGGVAATAQASEKRTVISPLQAAMIQAANSN
jgi:signal peptide peptidase SppA